MAPMDTPPPSEENPEGNSEDIPLSQPHDTFFKRVFARPEVAARFFRSHLPRELAGCAD